MKNNIVVCIAIGLSILLNVVTAQQIVNKNYVKITTADSKQAIIEKAAHLVPTEQQYMWQKLEFTGFVHFGMNTMTGREWGLGNEDPKIFNPEKLDPEQWVRSFKDAGMKMAILTAKHHDGFCLWPSNYTEHSVKNSPWKNGKGDLVREFVDACRKYDLKVGLYLSPWDRNNPSYGDSPKYNEFYCKQLTELLTNYGKVDEVWFDGACGEGPNGKKQVYDWQAYYRIIRTLQPQAVIFGMSPDLRWVGTETGYGRETEWSVIPIDLTGLSETGRYPIDEVYKPHDYVGADLGSREKLYAAKGLFWYAAEADVSIRPGWFYHKAEDDSVKSVAKLLDIYFGSVGRNCVLLINVPPDPSGLICQNDIDSLKALRTVIDHTFKKNLAEDATVTDAKGKSFPYQQLFGGKKTLIIPFDTTAALFEFDLPKEIQCDVLALQEDITQGQRIEKFRLEYLNGITWKTCAEGTTVGYKRLIRFNGVQTKSFRLVIEESRLSPTLTNVGFYKFNAQ